MNQQFIDLRSDTITKPTPAMRQAMAEAEVGDDVLGDDPTVKALESRTADILGKEASLFVPSGTMANQIAIRCHTRPGDEMLCDANAHIYYYEAGGPAVLSGVMCRLLPGVRGVFSAQDVQSALRPRDDHFPLTRLLTIENTHNRGGGSIWPMQGMLEICGLCHEKNIRTHLDGARLWNASAATGIPETEYAKNFDSISVCFSKGLGAPVGSALAGHAPFIEQARRVRKQLGGAMRQVGIIASGALHALNHHRDRLAQDHENARLLAQGLSDIEGLQMNPSEVKTNMVYFDVASFPAHRFVELLKQNGVLMLATGPSTVRAVTSLAMKSDDVPHVIKVAREIISAELQA